jgi:6-phosphofructokinase
VEGSRFGARAVECLMAGERNVMIGLNGRDMAPVPLEEVNTHRGTLVMDYYEMAKVLAR